MFRLLEGTGLLGSERAKPGLSEDIIQEVETAAETEAPPEVVSRAAGHVRPGNADAGTEGETLQGAGLDPGTSSPGIKHCVPHHHGEHSVLSGLLSVMLC
jgi:hypothetical protein